MQDEEGGQDLSFSSADELNLLNSYTIFLCTVDPVHQSKNVIEESGTWVR